jgi:hypothetical protein
MPTFTRSIGIDYSGAKRRPRVPSACVAEPLAGGAPTLVGINHGLFASEGTARMGNARGRELVRPIKQGQSGCQWN